MVNCKKYELIKRSEREPNMEPPNRHRKGAAHHLGIFIFLYLFMYLNCKYLYIYTGWVKKKRDLRRLVKKCNFLCKSSVWCFLNIFWKFMFFWLFNGPKKNPRTFSLSKSSSEKQKCVNKLVLSKSKILKRLYHRISENLQNCN